MVAARPPTSDAKWCLEQLFQHMEINLRNRVQAKTGRSTSLELNKLSNLMSHAGLAHASKPCVPLSPTRLKRLEGAIAISPEQRRALREVFIFYCGWAEKSNYLYMSSSQFLRFCKDTYLMVGDMDATGLALIFEKVQLESPDQAPGGRITLADWLQLLMVIALQISPGIPPQEAWDKVVADHVLMFGGKVDGSQDPLAQVMLCAEVVEGLGQAKHKLRPIFKFYANEQNIVVSPEARTRRPLPTVATTLSALSRPISPSAQRLDIEATPQLPATAAPTTHAPAAAPAAASTRLTLPGSTTPSPQPFVRSNSANQQQQQQQQPPQQPQPPSRQFRASARNSSGQDAMTMEGAFSSSGMALAAAKSGALLDNAARQLQGMQASGGGGNSTRPTTAASHKSAASQQQVTRARAQMPLPTFLRFLQDFDVLPRLVNKSQATACFRAARLGPGRDDDEGADVGRIDFVEFVEAVGRTALIAFNFQVKSEPEKLLSFENSYQRGAKALWSTQARQQLQEGLTGPSDVALPPAERDTSLGNEDSPHWDERVTTTASQWFASPTATAAPRRAGGGGDDDARSVARSTRSRAGGIFRSAQSLANYRVKRTTANSQTGGAVEVLALHDEAEALDTSDRPIHLKPYSPDWIGHPHAPLSELSLQKARWPNRALESGIYSGTDMGLPPVFRERAERMVEARVMREQAMEALRLMYVAERRQQQRSKVVQQTAKRQDLQLASGQPTFGGPPLPWPMLDAAAFAHPHAALASTLGVEASHLAHGPAPSSAPGAMAGGARGMQRQSTLQDLDALAATASWVAAT